MKIKKERIKRADLLNTKVGKYYQAVKNGKTKKEATILAGYRTVSHTSSIEKSKTYQEIDKHFKGELLQQTTMGNIAHELLKVISQDAELGPKVAAIKLALEKIEPQNTPQDVEERVVVVIR